MLHFLLTDAHNGVVSTYSDTTPATTKLQLPQRSGCPLSYSVWATPAARIFVNKEVVLCPYAATLSFLRKAATCWLISVKAMVSPGCVTTV